MENLDNLIICKHCDTLQKRVKLPKGSVAKCVECNKILYRNVKDAFHKSIAYSITALILFIVANLFPILNISIGGQKSSLRIFDMIYMLYNEGFFVVGSILIVVLVISPLVVMFSYLTLALIIYLKIFKSVARYIISFLIISRDWEMLDIFFISILVALVKLIGYAEVEFGVSFYALLGFIIVNIFILRNIKVVELWTMFSREYNVKKR